MPKSTKDCKQFLVEFFTRHPKDLAAIYNSPEREDCLKDASQINNWVREYKIKAQNTDDKGYGFPGYLKTLASGDVEIKKDLNDMAFERGFCLLPSKYEDSVKFQVFEDKDGVLYLGEYIGD